MTTLPSSFKAITTSILKLSTSSVNFLAVVFVEFFKLLYPEPSTISAKADVTKITAPRAKAAIVTAFLLNFIFLPPIIYFTNISLSIYVA